MGIWDTIRRHCGFSSSNQGQNIQGRKGKLIELKPRNHMIEQCEDRVLLSVSPSTVLDGSFTEYLIQQARESASNLANYDSSQLGSVTKWVVGFNDSSSSSANTAAYKYGANSLGKTNLGANNYVWEFSSNTSWETAASYLQSATGVDYFYPVVSDNVKPYSLTSEPYAQYQYYLYNNSQNFSNINVEGAWTNYTGAGITVGVLDQGIDTTHVDLINNLDVSKSYDYVDSDADVTPNADEGHGTCVSGIIGADGDNKTGVTGIAYNSTLYSFRMLGGDGATTASIASALNAQLDTVDVYNNSWGAVLYDDATGFYYGKRTVNADQMNALEKGVTTGRDGMGVIYVFSAGNDGEMGGDSNDSFLTASRYTITVGSLSYNGDISSYSTKGANVLVVAPGTDGDIYSPGADVVTTDISGEAGYHTAAGDLYSPYGYNGLFVEGFSDDILDYTSQFNGTSAAAPMVTGVVALMLEANPNLTWRDVQHILVESSIKCDSTDGSWFTNAAGYKVSSTYGFGLVDATAATQMAASWTNVGEETEVNVATTVNSSVGSSLSSSAVVKDSKITALETVEVTMNLTAANVNNMKIELVSPNGTVSVLQEAKSNSYADSYFDNTTLMSSVQFWGEIADGTWTLRVTDANGTTIGVLQDWTISLHGTYAESVGPNVVAVFPDAEKYMSDGDTLNVSPTELTVRFTEGQKISEASLRNSVTLLYRPDGAAEDHWEKVAIGYVGMGSQLNEIVIRPASTFLDGDYQVLLRGQLDPDDPTAGVLKNTSGRALGYTEDNPDGTNYKLDFTLELATQVSTVVPQPIENGAILANAVDVYFDGQDIDFAANQAEYLNYFNLIYTNDTANTTDDVTRHPVSYTVELVKTRDGAEVDADSTDPEGSVVRFYTKVRLTFEKNLDAYGTGSYRLNIGTQLKNLTTTRLANEGNGNEAAGTFVDASTLTDGMNNIFVNGGSYVINGQINSAHINYTSRWPGGNDEVGHKLQVTSTNGLQVEQHITGWDYDSFDAQAGLQVWVYCFPKTNGGGYANYITEQQKQAVREVFQLTSDYSGIQFYELETPANGQPFSGDIEGMLAEVAPGVTFGGLINFYVGDLGMMGGESGPGSVAGLGGGGQVCLDLVDFGESGDCGYNTSFFSVAMHEIFHNLGLGHTYELETPTIMGSGGTEYYASNAENMYPAPADIIHLQYLYRLDSNDIDMYKLTIPEGNDGKLSIETIAERLETSSLLDTHINLYNSKGELIATNDNYFGNDSFISVDLIAGDYFIGVTAEGNDDYDPTIENSGLNGTTEGRYQLKVDYVPNETQGIKDRSNLLLDGDNDGYAGGDFNVWFDIQDSEHTFIVDKTATAGGNVYNNIDDALKAAANLVNKDRNPLTAGGKEDSRVNVRVIGNNLTEASTAQQAYEVGVYNGSELSDGSAINVPKGVNLSFENGAIVKLYAANITAGSTKAITASQDEPLSDSEGSLQVYGTPGVNITFTSYRNENAGVDNLTSTTTPKSGDWGGLVFTNQYENEYNSSETAGRIGAVTVLEDEGIFLNYVAFADISYGGGVVNVNGKSQSYAPIYLNEARPTILNNVISGSATAAVSADPNSFEESEYYGSEGTGNQLYTADYNRIGPEFHGNQFVKTVINSVKDPDTGETTTHSETLSNNVNGVFIRTVTPDSQQTIRLTTTARFNDYDIPHVLQETLYISGNAGGSTIELNATDNRLKAVSSHDTGSLIINDRVVVKIANTRIELENGGTLIAEGENGKSIVFTSIYDDSYGNGGTFDTTSNGINVIATAGDWSGLYLNPSSKASLEYVKLMYAGGSSQTKDGASSFAPIEVTQADLRVANSYFADNAASATTGNRDGRGTIANGDEATIYVRNSQPIIVGNTFLDNAGAIISANANSMTADTVIDSGRQTGLLKSLTENATSGSTIESGFYTEYSDNSGPMVRANIFNGNSYNGMLIRGETLSTESVWDDTDIVHILLDEVVVGNHHTYSGLRLESSATASLVVKLQGENAGITAAGSPSQIEDRIGGTVQVIGNGTYPVIMTSLNDNTVGAGYDPWGNPMTKTNNRSSIGAAGDWRGIVIQEYSNDYNAATILEKESTLFSETGNVNGTIHDAQYIGKLADNLYSGDENLRLGFEIHGTIQSDRRADADIYSFDATAGTTIWVDVDLTRYALDTVVEILDANGNVLARSDNGEDLTNVLAYQDLYNIEVSNLASLEGVTVEQYKRNHAAEWATLVQNTIDPNIRAAMGNISNAEFAAAKAGVYGVGMGDDIWGRNSLDDYGINEKDSSFRITLPGTEGVQTTYYLRVTSAADTTNTAGYKGQTYGDYQVQVRLQEAQIKPGSTVQNAQIYYAENGISVRNMPSSSPLTVDTADVEIRVNGAGAVVSTGGANNTLDTAQPIGNVLSSDNCQITVTGYVNDATDIDWYQFNVELTGVQVIPGVTNNDKAMIPLVIDIDYADTMGRPDVDIWLFDAQGNLVASSRSTASITDDLASPMAGGDTSNLTAGSNSGSDSYLGTFYVPAGQYYVAIAPHGLYPATLSAESFRSEPVSFVNRVVEDNCTDIPGANNNLFSGIPSQTVVALNFQPESYSLADVRMYVMTAGDLFSVNSYTGSVETDWTTENANMGGGYCDVVMRSDGKMYAINNTNRTLREISLEDARNILGTTTIGVTSYFWNGDNLVQTVGQPRYSAFVYAQDVAAGYDIGDTHVVGYTDAGAETMYMRPMVAIANINSGDYQTNLLYLINPDGTVHSLDGDANGYAPKDGSDAVPLAQLDTALTLVTTDATDLNARNEGADADLRDGTRLTLTVAREGGEAMDIIMELDTGVDLLMAPNGPLSVRDGDTFSITQAGQTFTFEFDCGPVFNVDVAQIRAITVANGGQSAFSIRGVNKDNQTVVSTVQFILNAPGEGEQAPEGAIVLADYADTQSMALGAAIVEILRKDLGETNVSVIVGWNDLSGDMNQQDGENARISFTGATGSEFNRLEPLSDGDFGTEDPNNIRIAFTEWTANESIAGINAYMTAFLQNVTDTINRNILGITASYAHRVVTLAQDGSRILTLGDRICIAGLNEANLDLTGMSGVNELNAGLPGWADIEVFANRHNVVDDSLSTTGAATVATPNQVVIPIEISASLTAFELGGILANTVENYFLRVGDQYGFTLRSAIVGKNVAFSGVELVGTEVDAPLELRGEEGMRNGGNIQGLAWVGDKLYCVTGNGVTGEGGDLYEVQFSRNEAELGGDGADFGNFDMRAATQGERDELVRADGPELWVANGVTSARTDWDIIYHEVKAGDKSYLELIENEARAQRFSLRYVASLRDEAGNLINFSGLTNGPENAEGGIYSDLLFGTAADGTIYCFNTNGVFQTVFSGNQTNVQTVPGAVGVDFTTQDYNLWRRVQTEGTKSSAILDASRNAAISEVNAGLSAYENSYYFGIDDPSNVVRYVVNDQVSTDTLQKYITNSDLYLTYNAAGGTQGSMISGEFSLNDVASSDSPCLYFDYKLQTENSEIYDSFKVYIRCTDPSASALGDLTGADLNTIYNLYDWNTTGQWVLIGGNNDEDRATGAPNVLVESEGGWRQARIDLSAFAGLSNLQLKLEFSTAGGNYVGDEASTGSLLYGTEAIDLYPGDTFVIGENVEVGGMLVREDSEFVFRVGERLEVLSSPYYRLAEGAQTLTFQRENGTTFSVTVSRDFGADIQVTEATTATELAQLLANRINALAQLENAAVLNGNVVCLNSIELQNVDNSLVALQGTDRFDFSNGNIGSSFTVTNNLGQSTTYVLNGLYVMEVSNANINRSENTLPGLDMDYDGDVDDNDIALLFLKLYNENPVDGVSAYTLEGGSIVFQGANTVTASREIVQISRIRSASEIVSSGMKVADNPISQFPKTPAEGADPQPEHQQVLEFVTDGGATYSITLSNLAGLDPAILITATMSSDQLAERIAGLVNANLGEGLVTIVSGNILVFNGVTLRTGTQLLRAVNLNVAVSYGDSAEDVADSMATALDTLYSVYDPNNLNLDPNNEDAFHPTEQFVGDDGLPVHTVAKINSGAAYQLHLTGKALVSPGPLSGSNMQYGDSRFPAPTPIDNDNRLDSMGAGQNNAFAGVYVDTFIIGYAEHGEYHAGSTGNTTFTGAVPNDAVKSGYYTLNVRTGTDYGVYNAQENKTTLIRSMDTNDRLDGGLSLAVPEARYINHLDSFIIGDGNSEQKFVFVNEDIAVSENGSTAGWEAANIASQVIRSTDWLIYYNGSETASQISQKIVSAINTKYLSTYEDRTVNAFSVRAATSGTVNRVDLYEAKWVKGIEEGRLTANLDSLQYINYNSENAMYQDYVMGLILPTDTGQVAGDANVIQTQGQIILSGNMIAFSSNNGIQVYNDFTANESYQGANAAYATLNSNRTVPSVVAMNNILAYNQHYAIVYAGMDNNATDAGGNLIPTTEVPYGRVINNTIYGDDRSDFSFGVGVLSNASVTMINNVIANTKAGVYVDNSAEGVNSSLINLYTTYQNNGVNVFGNARTGANSIQLSVTDPLFVDPSRNKLNFYPSEGSKIIDSSLNVQEQRSDMEKVYNLLGISVSGLYAPELDIYDQVRADDPNTQSYAGTGSNAFKDRGAVERVDWTGPTATLINPLDKTAADKIKDQTSGERIGSDADRDYNPADVFVAGAILDRFTIQLTDNGVGIDDDTVTTDKVLVYRVQSGYDSQVTDAKKAFEDGAEYVELLGVNKDYLFKYDTTTNTIFLIPVKGSWDMGYTYHIEILDNSIYDLAGNELQFNRPNTSKDTLVDRTIFKIRVSGLNFGDAPAIYPTLLADQGAAHILSSGFMLGTRADSTSEAWVSDNADKSLDDDGVLFSSVDNLLKWNAVNTLDISVTNTDPVISYAADGVTVTNQTFGQIGVWVDLNADGDWEDDGEFFQFTISTANGATIDGDLATQKISLAIPANAANLADANGTFMRVRLFTPGYAPEAGTEMKAMFKGTVEGGEVEDYKVYIVNEFKDYGDAPISYGAAEHRTSGVFLGKSVDAELSARVSAKADGDDLATSIGVDDEDGIVFDKISMTPGSKVRFTATTSAAGYLYVWVDFNQDGVFSSEELLYNGYVDHAMDEEELESMVALPDSLVNSGNFSTFARVRFSETALEASASVAGTVNGAAVTYDGRSVGTGTSNGTLTNGEVEDYRVLISTTFYDYGDAPDSYKTTSAKNGAYHEFNVSGGKVISSYLGATITPDDDGQPSAAADSDEGDDGLALDGLFFVPGQSVSIPVTVTGAGYLSLWIDYNGDGEFGAAEQVTITSIDGVLITEKYSNLGYFLTEGEHKILFTVDAEAKVGQTYLRARFYDSATEGATLVDAASPFGFGGLGEVEDYSISVVRGDGNISGYKFNDLNKNGAWDLSPLNDDITIKCQSPSTTNIMATASNMITNVELGFDFEYFGKTYTSLDISRNGFVQFGADGSLAANNLRTAAEKAGYDGNVLAPFWATINSSAVVSYRSGTTETGARYFQVDWTNVLGTGGAVNAFTLYIENSDMGDIVAFVYKTDEGYRRGMGWSSNEVYIGVRGAKADGSTESVGYGFHESGNDKLYETLNAAQAYKFRMNPNSGVLGGVDYGIEGVPIYLDLNNDSKWNMGETIVFTDSTGFYEFTGLQPGSYIVREITIGSDIEMDFNEFMKLYPQANVVNGLAGDTWMQTYPNRFTGPADSKGAMQLKFNFGADSGTDVLPESTSLLFSLDSGVTIIVNPVHSTNTYPTSDAYYDSESNTYIVSAYYNNTLSTQTKDLATSVRNALNAAYRLASGSKNTIATTNKYDSSTVDVLGVYDMRVVDKSTGSGYIPSSKPTWFEVVSSYTQFTYDEKTASADSLSGWYVVNVGNVNEISGINFGNYRKPEVSVVDTKHLEQSDGMWRQVEVTIEIRKSFGSDVTVYYQTANGTADGYGNGLAQGETLSNETKAAAQAAGADFIHASGSFTFESTPCETPMEEWDIRKLTGTLYSDSSYKVNDYEMRMAGKYIAYVNTIGGQNTIIVYDTERDEEIWNSSGDDSSDYYNDIAVTSNGDVLLVWSKMDATTKRYELWYKFIEGGSSSDNEDGYKLMVGTDNYSYIQPVIGDDCVYFFRTGSGNSELCVLTSLDALKSGNATDVSSSVTVLTSGKWIIPNSLNVDGDSAVWVQASNETGYNNEYGQVYYRNGATGQVRAITDSTNYCSNPVIDGNYIVWQQKDILTAKSSIYMFDIAANGVPVCISNKAIANTLTGNQGNQFSPDISGDRIVWEGAVFDAAQTAEKADGKDYFRSEIYMYTISSGALEVISSGDGGCSDPSINGDLVAWTQKVNNGQVSYIWSLDLSSSSSAKNVSVHSPIVTTLDWKPLVTDAGAILWRGNVQSTGNYDIFIAEKSEPVIRETIKVWVWGDTKVEPDEYFKLLISATGDNDVVVTNEEAIVWILNDDSSDPTGANRMDYGDAGGAYATKASDNGPRHNYATTGNQYLLGTQITYETAPNTVDASDDGVTDESGKAFGTNSLYLGDASNAKITVTTPFKANSTNEYEDCYVDAWIDFNGDGVFSEDERIADSFLVSGGNTASKTIDLPFLIPQNSIPVNSYARFRVSKEGGLESTGYAATGEVEDYPVKIVKRTTTDSSTLTGNGTAADENFEMKLNLNDSGDLASIFLTKTMVDAKTNKTIYYYASVDGSSLTFTSYGSAVDEDFYKNVITADQLKKISSIVLNGYSGNDTISFIGTKGNELFNLYENEAFIYAKGLCIVLENFKDIDIDAQGGNDTIKFYGSNKQDTFTSGLVNGENQANYTNSVTYNNTVRNFDDTALIYAFGDADHGDTAKVETISGKSTTATFDRNDLVLSIADNTIIRKLTGFASLEAISVNSGSVVDTVNMMIYGSAKIDDTSNINVVGNGYVNIAKNFGVVELGAANSLAEIDLTGNESGDLLISPHLLSFVGAGSKVTATGFGTMSFDAAGYSVAARMSDSEGDDQLSMTSSEVQMKGWNYLNIVKNMKLVNAYSTAGGNDTAILYDSENDDYLYGQANSTAIYDKDKTYYNSASGFANVAAVSTSGNDKAFMYDSVGNDVLVSTSSYTQMVGSNYNNTVKGFNTVSAYSIYGGEDKATLYDSVLDDVLDAGDNWAQIASNSANQVRRVTDFATVNAVASNSGVKKATDNVNAVDFLFASGWSKD